ncbi:hypothetical protein RB599_005911 [Gaeumannomyces hyphopodioides]
MQHPVYATPAPPPAGSKYGTCRSYNPSRRRSTYQTPRRTASKNRPRPVVARVAAILLVLGALTIASLAQYSPFGWLLGQETPSRAVSMSEPSSPLVSAVEGQAGELKLRQYNLSLGQRWVNPDGGGWWARTTCNGLFSCPVLHAEEGELLGISLLDKPSSQRSVRWSGIGKQLIPYAALPQDQATLLFDTTGHWGLGWYMERTTGQGLYGGVWVAPAPGRRRPYRLLTDNPQELAEMLQAERNIKHLVIADYTGRDLRSRVFRMRAEGTEARCSDSILVNGKGRVHCRQEGYDRIGGHPLDEHGCARRPGVATTKCRVTLADYETLETGGGSYIMMNLLNIGLDHPVRASIDAHEMIVVANNGGFVRPTRARVVSLPNGGRVTVLVRLDKKPADYAVRVASTSKWQNLEGYAILRYPDAKSSLSINEPHMSLPEPATPEDQYLFPDGNAAPSADSLDDISASTLPPFHG